MESKTISVIDLFCGAGGLSLGFSKAFGLPFRHVWANDFDHWCAETYRINFQSPCLEAEIERCLDSNQISIPQADVVIGGPPCQGFSLLNKNRDDDRRRSLWYPFLQVVDRCGAKAFVMENVPQLLGSDEYQQILYAAEQLGFSVFSAKLCAADYGVPQVRWRAFIVGSKVGDPSFCFPPPPTHSNDPIGKGLPRWRTVRDAIEDLPEPVGTEIRHAGPPLNLHFGRNPTAISIQRYMAVPDEGMNRFDLQRIAPHLTPGCWIRKTSGGTDLFGRLWWDRPAFTIRTEFFKPEKGRYLHPSQHRPITHREAARLQSFPDSFHFAGPKIEIAKQIGNAVPPLLAANVAASIVQLLHSCLSDKVDGQANLCETQSVDVACKEQKYLCREAGS